MAKGDRVKRFFKGLRHPSQASASESASNTATEPHLKKPTDRANKSTSNTASTAMEPHLDEPAGRAKEASLTDNPPVKDPWSIALEKLSLEDKETMSRIELDSKLDILQHLQTTARERQTECEDQRWKFELKGRKIIIRDVLEKIIVWIDKVKQIGDIAVSFDPVHAALPWAGIRFLLQVGLIALKLDHWTEADDEADNGC